MINDALHLLKRNWRYALPIGFMVVVLLFRYPTVFFIFVFIVGAVAILVIGYIYVYQFHQMPNRLLFIAPYLALDPLPKYVETKVHPRERMEELWSENGFIHRVNETVYADEAIEQIAKAISSHLRQKSPQGALSILIAGEELGVGKGFLKDACVKALVGIEPKLFTVKAHEGTESGLDWDDILDRRKNSKINILAYDHITPKNTGEDFLLKLGRFQTDPKYSDWIVFLVVADPIKQGSRDEIVGHLEKIGLDYRLSQRAKALVVKPSIQDFEMGMFLAVLMQDHAKQAHLFDLYVPEDEVGELHDFLTEVAHHHNLTSSKDILKAKHLVEQTLDELVMKSPPDSHGRLRLIMPADMLTREQNSEKIWHGFRLEPASLERKTHENEAVYEQPRSQSQSQKRV